MAKSTADVRGWGFVGCHFGSLKSCLAGVYGRECSGGGGDVGSGGDGCRDRNSSSDEGEIGDICSDNWRRGGLKAYTTGK